MFLRFVLLLFLVIPIAALITSRIFPQENSPTIPLISPLSESVRQVEEIVYTTFAKESLSEVVKKAMEGTRGTYGIVIKNLKTGESYMQNEDMEFTSASLYKLWVMGAVYKEIVEGNLELDQKLSESVSSLNSRFKLSSDSAELTSGTIATTVENALEKMITISDNYTALLLSAKIRNSKVSAFIKDQGLSSSKLGSPPVTTPLDIAHFYEKLYEGKIIDTKTSDEMMDLLKRQQLNDRIPKYLPKDTVVAHKTGELDSVKHDAGIIFGKDPILFVILSKSNAPLGAAEREAILSRAVFQYFNN